MFEVCIDKVKSTILSKNFSVSTFIILENGSTFVKLPENKNREILDLVKRLKDVRLHGIRLSWVKSLILF